MGERRTPIGIFFGRSLLPRDAVLQAVSAEDLNAELGQLDAKLVQQEAEAKDLAEKRAAVLARITALESEAAVRRQEAVQAAERRREEEATALAAARLADPSLSSKTGIIVDSAMNIVGAGTPEELGMTFTAVDGTITATYRGKVYESTDVRMLTGQHCPRNGRADWSSEHERVFRRPSDNAPAEDVILFNDATRDVGHGGLHWAHGCTPMPGNASDVPPMASTGLVILFGRQGNLITDVPVNVRDFIERQGGTAREQAAEILGSYIVRNASSLDILGVAHDPVGRYLIVPGAFDGRDIDEERYPEVAETCSSEGPEAVIDATVRWSQALAHAAGMPVAEDGTIHFDRQLWGNEEESSSPKRRRLEAESAAPER